MADIDAAVAVAEVRFDELGTGGDRLIDAFSAVSVRVGDGDRQRVWHNAILRVRDRGNDTGAAAGGQDGREYGADALVTHFVIQALRVRGGRPDVLARTHAREV